MSKNKTSKFSAASDSEYVTVQLGIPRLIELENPGYLPIRPEVSLTPRARLAVKRLALTLDVSGEKLGDGTLVKGSVQKTICWLCEKLADSI